jgi:polar amino acid transport system substrate-binding protein
LTSQSNMLYNHRMRKYLIILAIIFLTVSCSTVKDTMSSAKDSVSNLWDKIKPFKDNNEEASKRLDALEAETGGGAADKAITLIASGHPDYPPIMWQEGDYIAGVGTEVLKLAFEGLNTTVDSTFQGSWRQVLDKAASGEIDAIVGAYTTDERRKTLEFSVPYMKDPVAIFVARDKAFPFKKLVDLAGKRGTSTVGDGFGPEVDKFIAQKLTVTRALTAEDNFNRLLSGEADYFICAMYSGLLEAEKLGISDKIEYLPTYAVNESVHIAMSKKSKYLKYMPEINKKIESLIKDGTVDKLIDEKKASYLEAFKARGRK